MARARQGSDAYHLYEESGRCCPPRCIGFWWLINAIVMQVVGVIVAIMQLSDECKGDDWFGCIFEVHIDIFDIDWSKVFGMD